MVRPIVKDVLLLGRRAEAAVEADLPVVQDLMDTLRAHTGHCVGLAANMIGVNKRIIVVDGGGVPFPCSTLSFEKEWESPMRRKRAVCPTQEPGGRCAILPLRWNFRI